MACNCCEGQFRTDMILLDHKTPKIFGKSQVGRLQAVYIVYRWLWAMLFIGVWGWDISRYTWKYVIYFTNWIYVMCVVSSLLEAFSAMYEVFRTKPTTTGEPPIKKPKREKMPVLYKVTWVFHNIIISGAPTVTAVYWALIFDFDKGLTHPVIVFTHGVNTVYVIINVLLISGIPVRVYHMWHGVLVAIIYVVFTGIYYLFDGTNSSGEHYIYSIIDYRDGLTTALLWDLCLVFVFVPVVHLVMFGLYRARLGIYRACCPRGDEEVAGEREDFTETWVSRAANTVPLAVPEEGSPGEVSGTAGYPPGAVPGAAGYPPGAVPGAAGYPPGLGLPVQYRQGGLPRVQLKDPGQTPRGGGRHAGQTLPQPTRGYSSHPPPAAGYSHPPPAGEGYSGHTHPPAGQYGHISRPLYQQSPFYMPTYRHQFRTQPHRGGAYYYNNYAFNPY